MRTLFFLISLMVSFAIPHIGIGAKASSAIVSIVKAVLTGLRPFMDGCKVLAAVISLYQAIAKQREHSRRDEPAEVLEATTPRLLIPLMVFAASITLLDSIITLIETIIR